MYLTIWDLILTPVFLLVLYFFAKRHRDKNYPASHPLHTYYLPGLLVKFFGAVFIALIYQYYYGGGDTFNYFSHAKIINSALDDSFTSWVKLLFRVSPDRDPTLYKYTSQMPLYRDAAGYPVAVIAALLGLISGTSYVPTALLFAFFSYTGIWAMYKTFANLYPKAVRPLAIAFLFIPSVFVWGSSIFKDTICMFGLGWMTYTTFRIFVHRDFSFKNLLLLAFSFYLIAVIKIYILVGFLPAAMLWLLLSYSHKIRSGVLRFITNISVVAVVIAGFVFFSQKFSEELGRYSLEKISKTAESTRSYISYVSEREGGSAYNLGEFDPSIGGMISKFPEAVVVTLFRPFPWEAGKVIIMLSSLEALIFLFFTLKVLYQNGLKGTYKLITTDPNIMFCLIFSLIFAFSVGISSYNFGTLSRYKIPCLPFYGAFLTLLLYKKQEKKTFKKSISPRQHLIHVNN
jgi:hypothetical protein